MDAARAENVVAFAPRTVAFEVFPGSASDQAQLITASDPADALERFLEGWHPAVEPADNVEITVVERASGVQTHFVFDLS